VETLPLIETVENLTEESLSELSNGKEEGEENE
jgi:hypothetical protein